MWKTVAKRTNLMGREPANYAVRVAKNKTGRVEMKFGPAFMERIGWQKGDRVELLVNEQERVLGVRRCGGDGGWKLSRHGASSRLTVFQASVGEEVANSVANGTAREFSDSQIVVTESGIVCIPFV